MKNKKGFTLIELLVVVSIIGIVASLAIPNLLSATQKSRQKATMADMKTIGTAIEMYTTDHYIAPSDLTFGNSTIKDFYVRKMPNTDNWGNDWEYQSDKETYYLGSSARDGIFFGFDQEGSYKVNSNEDLNKDIIFSNGSFIYAPGTVGSGSENTEDDNAEPDDQSDDDSKKDKKEKKEKKKKKKKKNKKKKK